MYVRGHIDKECDGMDSRRWLKRHRIDIAIGMAPPFMKAVDHLTNYVYHPIRDGKLTKRLIKDLKELAAWVAKRYRRGKRIVIYCRMGRSRSCMVAALVLTIVRKMSGKQAVRYMRARRAGACTRNKHFVGFLESL